MKRQNEKRRERDEEREMNRERWREWDEEKKEWEVLGGQKKIKNKETLNFRPIA